MIDAKKTGFFIKEQRKKLGLSQLQLAELLHVEPQTISKWERGLGMPDYDNIARLKEVFDCELSDILEPEFSEARPDDREVQEAEERTTYLPVLSSMFDARKAEEDPPKKRFSVFDYLNKKKIAELIGQLFGYEYVETYNRKFLFKGVARQRSRAEYETTLTQGMFAGRINHTVLGFEAPWLYLRVLLFMLASFGLSLVAFFLFGSVMPLVLIASLSAVVPLIVFLFESNFSRNISIFDLIKIFIWGGLLSLICLFFVEPILENEVVTAVVIAPIFEELAKAAVAVSFISRIKPQSMLTGLLIGFTVGAGFDTFETLNYSFMAAISGEELVDALVSPVITVVVRTLASFFSGHHYFTGIFCAVYVLFKKQISFAWSDLCNWRVSVTLLFSMGLHSFWNASSFFVPALATVVRLLISLICVASVIILINIGIAEIKIMEIYEEAKEDTEKEDPVAV